MTTVPARTPPAAPLATDCAGCMATLCTCDLPTDEQIDASNRRAAERRLMAVSPLDENRGTDF